MAQEQKYSQPRQLGFPSLHPVEIEAPKKPLKRTIPFIQPKLIKPLEIKPPNSSPSEEKTMSPAIISHIDSNPEVLPEKHAWHDLPPTHRQISSITRMCMALRVREPLEEKVANRMEARNVIHDLRQRLKRLNLERKSRKLK